MADIKKLIANAFDRIRKQIAIEEAPFFERVTEKEDFGWESQIKK